MKDTKCAEDKDMINQLHSTAAKSQTENDENKMGFGVLGLGPRFKNFPTKREKSVQSI